jgi:hypothetical protein
MKKLLLALLFAHVLISCKKQIDPPKQPYIKLVPRCVNWKPNLAYVNGEPVFIEWVCIDYVMDTVILNNP